MVPLLLAASACGAASPRYLSPGRPTYDTGAVPGFWIWHDDAGWHLRTTTSGDLHRFRLIIEPVEGAFTRAQPTRPELAERMRSGPHRIELDLRTRAFDEGLDWDVTSGCNRFWLELNGEAKTGRVYLGPNGHPPASIPFVRCTPASRKPARPSA